MAFRIVADKVAAPKFKQNLAGLHDRFQAALTAAMNMAASLIKQEGDADIAGAGNFGGRWTTGLHVILEGAAGTTQGSMGNMRISMTHDIPYAGIFETGGIIRGNPLLWIPLSGSGADHIPASEYGGGLFSVQPRSGKHPLLFSIADKMPKYFGIEQVTIPKKFHLNEIQKSVMANFRQLFDQAFRGS
jgi:hypothetical protein